MQPSALPRSDHANTSGWSHWQTTPGRLLPGITLASAVAILALSAADWLGAGFPNFPVSAIMLTILLGMLISNLAPLDAAFQPGLQFCLGRVLQLGIVLLGIRLSLAEFAVIGVSSLPLIAVTITSAVFIVSFIGRRLGLSAQLSTLIAVGTSICGATATVTTAPVIRARPHEVSYAITCITLFGMAAVLAYPLAANWLFRGAPEQVGLFLGTAIHDTAQVVGAGMVYQNYFGAEEAMNTATVTKLVRNLSMLIVIPALSIMFHRSNGADTRHTHPLKLIPLFIVGFAVMSLLRTLGDLGVQRYEFLDAKLWETLIAHLKLGAEFCLLLAMAAVGLNASLAGMRTAGLKPLAAGLAAATLVGLLSFTIIYSFY